MRILVFIALSLVIAGCHSVENDLGSVIPDVEIRVLRLRPDVERITLGQHEDSPFLDVEFSVLDPEEFRGRKFKIKIVADSAGQLFMRREFRLRLPRNVVEGKNREKMNSDGTTTVWADTEALWNFETMVVKENNGS